MSVELSLTAPQFSEDFRPVRAMVRSIQDLDLDGIFFFDHLIPLGDPTRPILELVTTLGAAAAVADSIIIGSLVMRATLRDPAITRSAAMTVDRIAGGRFVLGLGAGDSMTKDETQRLGLDFDDLDTRIEVLTETALSARSVGIEVWIGGLHRRVRAVAGRVGGWNGWDIDAPTFAEMATPLRAGGSTVTWGGPVLLGRNEDDMRSLTRSREQAPRVAGTPEAVAAQLSEYVSGGADHLVVSVIPNQPDRWELFASEVAPTLRQSAGEPQTAGS